MAGPVRQCVGHGYRGKALERGLFRRVDDQPALGEQPRRNVEGPGKQMIAPKAGPAVRGLCPCFNIGSQHGRDGFQGCHTTQRVLAIRASRRRCRNQGAAYTEQHKRRSIVCVLDGVALGSCIGPALQLRSPGKVRPWNSSPPRASAIPATAIDSRSFVAMVSTVEQLLARDEGIVQTPGHSTPRDCEIIFKRDVSRQVVEQAQ